METHQSYVLTLQENNVHFKSVGITLINSLLIKDTYQPTIAQVVMLFLITFMSVILLTVVLLVITTE